MNYQTTLLEDWIKNFYYKIDIYHPHQLDILEISGRLGIYIDFRNMTSRIYEDDIIIDKRLSPEQQWEEFGHELGHYYRQEGNQLLMHKDFLDLQEYKAENFALHFCIPTFMLLNYQISNYVNIKDGIKFVSEKFNVTQGFAQRRLSHFRNQIQQSISDHHFKKQMKLIYPKADPNNWSDETKSLLDKLNKQTDKKKQLQGV